MGTTNAPLTHAEAPAADAALPVVGWSASGKTATVRHGDETYNVHARNLELLPHDKARPADGYGWDVIHGRLVLTGRYGRRTVRDAYPATPERRDEERLPFPAPTGPTIAELAEQLDRVEAMVADLHAVWCGTEVSR